MEQNGTASDVTMKGFSFRIVWIQVQVEQIVGGVLFIPWLLIMQSVKQISIYSPISERAPCLSSRIGACLAAPPSVTTRHHGPLRS